MYFNFKTGKRMESNIAETKVNFRKNFVVVGSDSKGKSYTTRVEDMTLIEAKREAERWAKSHSLTLDVVKAV